MARTEEQIAEALQRSIENTDSTQDVVQGPIPDILIRPQSGELAIAESDAEELRQLFTLQFPDVITEEEARNALGNYGSSPGEGSRSRHIQYFMRFNRPVDDIVIPAGTLVSNIDGTRVYRTLTSGTIFASSANAFFNPSRNAFEIGLQVEATGTGEEFELPRFRVNTLVTPVPGIDSTENRARSRGGNPQESLDEQAERLKSQLKGLNLGAPGGITRSIENELTEQVSDVQVVQPFESEFERITDKPALDIYVIGSSINTETETFVAQSNQTQLVLSRKPVTAVLNLRVNNVSLVGFELVKDTSLETGNSINATDIVVLDTPLLFGDIITVEYEYNQVLENIQNDVFSDGTFLFNTDILLRLPFEVNPRIEGRVRVLPSYSTTEVEEALNEFLETELTFTEFREIIFPETFRRSLISSVTGIQSFDLNIFRRNEGALLDIEPLKFGRNERSVFDSQFIDIRVVE